MEFVSNMVKQSLQDPSKYQARMAVSCNTRMALVGDNGRWRWETQA